MYTDRSRALALRPIRPRFRERRHISSSESSTITGRPSIVAAKPLPSAVCVTSGVKSTFAGVYSELSTFPVSKNVFSMCLLRLRLVAPERGGVAEPGEHDLVAVREVRQQLRPVALTGGVAKSSVPPTSSVSTFESRTVAYSFSSGSAGQASISPPPA